MQIHRVPEAGGEHTEFPQGFKALSETGGAQGGAIGFDSEAYNRFVDQLKAAGFSVDPLILIGDALRESQTRSALPTPMRNG